MHCQTIISFCDLTSPSSYTLTSGTLRRKMNRGWTKISLSLRGNQRPYPHVQICWGNSGESRESDFCGCVGYWHPSHHPACSVGGWSVLDATDGAWTRFAVGKGSSCDTVGRALCCCVLFPLYILCCVLFPKYMPTLNSHKCQRGFS